MGEYIRYIETDRKCCIAARFMRHIQPHMHAHTHTYNHTNTQIHKHRKTHTRTHATTQTRRYTHIQKHIQEHIQPHKHADTHTCKNTYTHMLSTDTVLAKQEAHSTHTQTCIHSFITSIYIAPLQVGLLKGVHTYINIHEKHTRVQHSGKARGTYIHPCTHIRTHTTTYTRRYTHTNTYKRRFTHIQTHIHAHASIQILMNRAHSFPRQI